MHTYSGTYVNMRKGTHKHMNTRIHAPNYPGNVVPQYLCITAVFVLTAECSSLTATLVLTFRWANNNSTEGKLSLFPVLDTICSLQEILEPFVLNLVLPKPLQHSALDRHQSRLWWHYPLQ